MQNLPIVPGSTLAAMFAAALLCIVLPIVALLCLHKKNGSKISYFFVGCAVFVVFALVLEAIVHNIVLVGLPVGKTITGNIWLYGLYGGVMAGLFEETGRFVAMKTLMRKSSRISDSLMYGAGHGGAEAALLASVSLAEYALFCILSNAGLLSDMLSVVDETTAAQFGAVITQYADSGVLLSVLAFAERVSAVAFHVAASVLVYIAAKKKGKLRFYPLAILLHAAFDFAAVVIANYLSNMVLVEAIIMAFAVAVCVGVGCIYKKEKNEEKALAEAVAAEGVTTGKVPTEEVASEEVAVEEVPAEEVTSEDIPAEEAAVRE